MKKIKKFIFFLIFGLLSPLLFMGLTLAEDLPAGRTIPKIPQTANDPVLSEGKVYPFWGPVCQRYTYSVVYSDKEGRTPEYVKIYFNGQMIDMEKEDKNNNDYKNGVKYIFKNVPNKFGSNFYYFEASNGVGKARDSIIDSPDNGPVLFDSDFKNNEIVLIDPSSGKENWRYPTGEEWVGGVALSDDGKYLAAQTSYHIYLFNTAKKTPLWSYESKTNSTIGGDVKGGVAISGGGEKIFAALNGKALMFDISSNKPVWEYNLNEHGGGAYGVALAKNGQYAAVAMAGEESNENTNVLLLFNSSGKKLWQYHAAGNWHEVNFSSDGSYLAGATGCPDRRGYIFSKDSPEPILKSDPLSGESPIDEAVISADGSLAAFGVESGFGAVILMNRGSKEPVWKYQTSENRSVRTLAMTSSGEFIGAGTFNGDILIFNKVSAEPIKKLKINASIGAFDLADDASFFAAGGTDKKIRIFEKDSDEAKAEIELNEYVGELDIAANGKYIAAGTSGAVYFFETIINLDGAKVFPCDNVIEPKADTDTTSAINQTGSNDKKTFSWITLTSFSVTLILIIIFTVYLLVSRRRRLPLKKWLIILLILFIAVSGGLSFYLWQKAEKENNALTPEDNNIENQPAECGNSLCEPEGGENRDSCAKDCSGG